MIFCSINRRKYILTGNMKLHLFGFLLECFKNFVAFHQCFLLKKRNIISYNANKKFHPTHQNRLTWNCWNFSPSAVNCNLKFFSVDRSCATCSEYNFIRDCSCFSFSSCCWSFRSASWSSRDFCFSCKAKTKKEIQFCSKLNSVGCFLHREHFL